SELRAERAATPADTVAARAAALEEDDRALVEEIGDVRAAIETTTRQRAELESGRGAELAAQDEATAAAGLAGLARNYALVEAACLLVTAAIERHRARYQDPLIARASRLFTAVTGKSFEGLALDYGDDDMLTIVAQRAAGRPVKIAGLSEGTRDQLYLALRLAALAEFAARADPLPFICDDLLVSFDDVRAGFALDALAQAAEGMQVILFTHHRHVVELAAARLQHQADIIEL
ncbi:MAG: chromosome segregation protein SMC, partial [Bradyrhizobium sp.]